jgi:PTS system fructose-specific IIC component
MTFQPGGVDPRLVFPDLAARTRDEALAEIAGRLEAAGVVRDAEDLAGRLTKREREGCTGVGKGVAFPHCRVDGISDAVLAVARSSEGIDFGAPDGVPISVFFLLLSPKDAPALHLQALARLTRLARAPGLIDEVRAARSAEEIAAALRQADAALTTAAAS